ncbi:jg18097 [Pararge aegeria aegeria]|uniref:Jg18097 protein n=1 Tax=Pararge aegeria aegeria TaxID=348720 RepID=A0A8S4S3B1_9NEOP|nr:jg18097 [Pararge aegeria aegeria]
MPCGDGRSEYSCRQPSFSRGCCTRRLREENITENGKQHSLYFPLLPSIVISSPSAQRGDNGQTHPFGVAFSEAVES